MTIAGILIGAYTVIALLLMVVSAIKFSGREEKSIFSFTVLMSILWPISVFLCTLVAIDEISAKKYYKDKEDNSKEQMQ